MVVEKYTNKELMKDLSELSGYTQADLKEAIGGYLSIVREALLSGKEVELKGIGKLELVHVNGKPERDNQILDPRYPDVRGIRPATPSHYKIHFKITQRLRAEIKEKTLGM